MSARKRALVIGSQTGGLEGVDNDVAAIGSRLEARGFVIDRRTEHAATRAGILAGLRDLSEASDTGDVALIYYSGHGARIHNPRYHPGQRNGRQLLPCIVPWDWDDEEFRGILDIELSLALAELTRRTHNVAVILDCCHSARMWRGRGEQAVARAHDRVHVAGVGAHLDELARLDMSGLHGESNPHAVRLVACEADRSAYELPLELDGKVQRMGIMTAMLATVLDELGDARVTWRTLVMLVRERVMQRYDLQRPGIEGPGQRYLFELATAGGDGGVVYFHDHEQPALRTSRLLGAEVGARYAIMPIGCSEYDEAQAVAEAEVTAFEGPCAHVRVSPRPGTGSAEVGALAFPLAAPFAKLGVLLRGSAEPLRQRIAASRFVTVAPDDGVGPLTVEVGEDIVIRGPEDALLSEPERNDPDGCGRALATLELWARAERLRNLGDGGLRARFEVEWGRVVDHARVPMNAGDTVHVGDRLYVSLRNCSDQRLVFAVFDIGVDGIISLLTPDANGTELEPGESFPLGLTAGRSGLEATWPEHLPAAVPLPESFLIVASTDRHDFEAFETQRAGKALSIESELGRMLRQIGRGETRNFTAQRSANPSTHAVKRIDYELSPVARAKFVVEQPAGRAALERALVREPATQPRHELAIRLSELVVERNRASWVDAEIRVDTLCVTGGGLTMATHVFDRIADGARVAFDDLRVFEGPATGFVDFAIWVSQHDGRTAELSELFRDLAGDSEVAGAVTTLERLTASAPAVGLAAAIAAAGILAYRIAVLLEKVPGRHIGLYRCSFLPQENWGIGVHPVDGRIRAQDFSFRYEVI